MEVNEQPTLRQLLWKGTRFAPFVRTELDDAFRHAGAWLREFHRLSGDEAEMGTLRAQRGEVVAALAAYGQFLEERVGATQVLKDAVSTAILRARTVLPPALPLGLAHGDFAPRNVFVSPNGRVTVIDMIGKWRAPIYEDLAYFITALRMSGAQRFSHGAAFHRDSLDRYEHEVLIGYFGAEDTPYGPIRVFKLLLLLDKWASLPAWRGRRTVPARVFRAASETLSRRYFSREVASLAAELEAAA
jgi:phosphotransferase family enzyme